MIPGVFLAFSQSGNLHIILCAKLVQVSGLEQHEWCSQAQSLRWTQSDGLLQSGILHIILCARLVQLSRLEQHESCSQTQGLSPPCATQSSGLLQVVVKDLIFQKIV